MENTLVNDWVLQETECDDGGVHGYWVSKSTGVAIPAPLCYMEPGSEYRTAKQVVRNRQYGEMMRERHKRELQAVEKDRIRSEHLEKMKPYLYVSADDAVFNDLPADTMARATYLATFLRFGSDELWSSQRTKLSRAKLAEAMRLGKSKADEFWRDVNKRYFYRDSDGFLHTQGRAFVMGPLNAVVNEEYQVMCMSAYRELYEQITPRQHKRLGYVLKMLPYLNFEYNILAYNPMETDRSEIIPMTVSDFCDEVGYDRIHARDLMREYGKIAFTVNGLKEVFCKFLFDGDNIGRAHIYINPNLIFKGSDPRKVETIGLSFSASTKPVKDAAN